MDWTFGIFSYFTVWILSLTVFYGSSSNAAPAPRPGEDNMLGEYGDLFGTGLMANHVPRLGRRSLSPFNSKQRNGFRFFGAPGDGGGSGELNPNRNLAGFFGPLFNRYENFRYYGGRPGEELARGLLRDKRQQEEYSDGLSLQADKADIGKDIPAQAPAAKTKASKPDIDQDYWQNVIGEATINSVLEKMAEIGETREVIEDFNRYKAFGVGNPLPKYLARWNHPVNTPKVSVPQTSYPNKDVLNKYKSYYPQSSVAFPRRKKGRTFTRIFSRR